MNKNTLKYYLAVILVLGASQAMAEDSALPGPSDNEYNMQDAGLSPAPEAQPERREARDGGGKEKMKGGMGKGMMHHQPSVVATSDGGVVVLDGPRLLKYDGQLNLIGEAELKRGEKGPQMKKDEVPAVELPAVENPAS